MIGGPMGGVLRSLRRVRWWPPAILGTLVTLAIVSGVVLSTRLSAKDAGSHLTPSSGHTPSLAAVAPPNNPSSSSYPPYNPGPSSYPPYDTGGSSYPPYDPGASSYPPY